MSSKTARFYLIRHAETASNTEGRFRGRLDIPLNDNGRIQTKELAGSLCHIPFDAIYSSPLSRAVETAESIVISRTMKVILHEAFNNIDLGEWKGRLKAEIMVEYPELWRQWTTVPELMTIPGGEAISDVQKRSLSALETIIAQYKEGIFAIVTHRAVLKPLIAGLLSIPVPYFWKLSMDTGGYSVFDFDSERGYSLILYNETCHLSKVVEERF